MHPSRGTRFWLALSLICLGGLALRVFLVLDQQESTPSPYLIGGDGIDYLRLSGSLAAGNGLIDWQGGESGRPPLWTGLLALARLAMPGAAVKQLQLFAAVVGSVSIGLMGLAGRKIAGPAVGLIGAAIAAVDPGFWIFEWPLLSETLCLAFAAGSLLAVYGFIERPGLGRAMLLGALSAGLALVRSEQILIALFVVVPVVLTARDTRLWRRAIWLLSAGATTIAVIAPWVLFNLSRFEEPVFLSTGFGNTLSAGNCDWTYGGELLGYYSRGCALRRATGLPGDGSVKDRALRRAAVDYMLEHLGRLPVVVLAREGRVWGLYKPGSTSAAWARWSLVPDWQSSAWFLALYLLLPLATVGTFVLRRNSVLVYPLWAFVAVIVIATGITMGNPRYRAPAEPAIVVLAAVGIAALREKAGYHSDAGTAAT